MFAIPVVLFEGVVGRSELYYRLLEARYGAHSRTHFVNNLDTSAVMDRISDWQSEQIGDPELERAARQLRLLSLTEQVFAEEQDEAVRGCRAFREDYPQSRYVPNALYLEGRARDLRVDRIYFERTGRVRYYQDFPADGSRPVWQELYTTFGDHDAAPVAGYRLALLMARSGKPGEMDQAVAILDRLIGSSAGTRRVQAMPRQTAGLRELLSKQPAGDTLAVDAEAAVTEARKLRELLVNNRDPHQDDKALRELLRLDPQHRLYTWNLQRLLAEVQAGRLLTRLGDNIELLLARSEPSASLKIERLRAVFERYGRESASDVRAQTLYELGVAYQSDNRTDEARQAFERVMRDFAATPWELEAKGRLANMGVSASGS
jgi:hypothetical protein